MACFMYFPRTNKLMFDRRGNAALILSDRREKGPIIKARQGGEAVDAESGLRQSDVNSLRFSKLVEETALHPQAIKNNQQLAKRRSCARRAVIQYDAICSSRCSRAFLRTLPFFISREYVCVCSLYPFMGCAANSIWRWWLLSARSMVGEWYVFWISFVSIECLCVVWLFF